MEKHCLLTGRHNSLFRQLVAGLLKDLTNELTLHESRASDFMDFLNEVSDLQPDMILLDDSSPFSEDSLLTRLLINEPALPVIVISENSNVMHIVRRESVMLNSSNDLIKAIDLVTA